MFEFELQEVEREELKTDDRGALVVPAEYAEAWEEYVDPDGGDNLVVEEP